ncbi:MAG: penicillin-binding protein 2 [Candidatus Dormibacteria bacterium]
MRIHRVGVDFGQEQVLTNEEVLSGRVPGFHQGARPVTRRTFLFGSLIVVAFGGLLWRLGNLDLVQGAYFRSLADHNRIRRVSVRALRGVIFDRAGRQLVENVPNEVLSVVPADLPLPGPERTRVLNELELVLGLKPKDVEDVVTRHAGEPFEPAVVRRGLLPDQAGILREREPEMPGVHVEVLPSRRYLEPVLVSHVLGYVSSLNSDEYTALAPHGYLIDDQVGQKALEAAMETQLRGTYGQKEVETDVSGSEVQVIAQIPAQSGLNLTLSIELELQRAVTGFLQAKLDELSKSLGPSRGQDGVAIVMDPRTGQVLALASLPSYDINQFAEGITQAQLDQLDNDPRKPQLDRSVRSFPPGSTYKIVTACAALQEGRLQPNTIINCTGVVEINGYQFYCWNRSGHGQVDLNKAIAISCDAYFYEAAQRVGDQVLAQYGRAFGIGEPTGIELDGEGIGVSPDREWKAATWAAEGRTPEPWYTGDTLHCGIGQGFVLVTPMQLARLTAAVANGGALYHPTFIKSTTQPGQPAQPQAARLGRQLPISPNVLAAVRRGLREATLTGTAFEMRSKPWEVAAKTGTAEYGTTPDSKGNLPTHAWFTCFAPYSAPEVVVVVFIDGGGEGAIQAQPVAAQILDYYFAHRSDFAQ